MLYDQNVGYLTAACARYITDDTALKDVLQNAFLQIFRSIGKFSYRGEGSFRAWATRIVVNEALKSFRGPKTLPLPETEPAGEEDTPDIPAVPMKVLLDMIRQLPDGYRTVFNLYVFEDLSHKQIAERLGIKEDSSASQLSRAKSILARQIKQYKKTHENG